ncbi:M48 family metalloprotease [Balneolales bacterium ANBcel1]|nr:M48 family metalloprotease [Balneolales bacterium ANBcel1]
MVLVALLLVSGSCAVQQNPVTGSTRLLAYTWSQEVEIGREVDREFTAQYGLYDDPNVSDYVDELSRLVLAESHMRREYTDAKFRETEFYFRVLDSPVVNAFALPGGYVYVTRGLLAHLNNDAQLAVVIGHEIGHVAARHASQRQLRQSVGQIAILGGAILGQEFLGIPGEPILNLSSQAAQLIFLSYGRSAERESDRLGVEYAARAGFAAEEGAAFFTSLKRISEASGQTIPTWLSSHPDPGEREQNIPTLAREWRERGYEQTIRNEETYMEMLDGMLYGDNPREGFVDGDRFVHPDLEFQFPVPDEWRLINERNQVILLAPSENAVMIFRIDGESASARESVQSFARQEGITVNSETATQSSDRHSAYQADVTITQDAGNLRALVYAVEFDNRIYRYISYSSADDFDTFRDDFRTVPESFDRLTDRDILAVQPARLQIVRVEEPGVFEDFLPDPLPRGITAGEVAIINQVEEGETVDKGRLLKIPVQ